MAGALDATGGLRGEFKSRLLDVVMNHVTTGSAGAVLASVLLLAPACSSRGEMAPPPQMATSTPYALKYSRADIFFFSWDATTSTELSVADVRRQPQVSLTYSLLDADAFANWLQGQVRRLPSGTPSRDVRLVIDFSDGRGATTTFYATRFGLYSADGLISRELDDAFRKPFAALRFGAESMWGHP